MDNDQSPQQQPDSSDRIGQWMLYLFWAAVLGIGTWFAQGFLDNKENPNQQLQTTINADGLKEVVLQRNAYGHYVSSGKINGVDVVFFLDTGASSISIPEHVAQKIGLERGVRYTVSTANGEADAYATQLDRVELGDIALNHLRGSINPNVDYDEILLGMSFLKHVEFTQKGRQLILRQ